MPDIIKRKALEEQERNRQTDKASELPEAVKETVTPPVREIEWADPPKHPNREAEMVPLPTHTGGKEAGKAAQPLFRHDAVSPFGKGLAQMMALSDENPEAAKRLYQTMMTSERDSDSPYYRPYALPTNQWMMEELSRLGIDTSNMDEKWFRDNAWLKRYARFGAAGMPKVPTQSSSREETAAYYYIRLEGSEGRTKKAEAELNGLQHEIGYWANRKDRNYSDEEIVSRINWNKYPTLAMLREDRQKGRPAPLNRAVDFDNDTVYGMLWSARNGNSGGSSTANAARYALGEGRQYEPDESILAKRDPKSHAYNPYALGSTVDEAAEYFGVDSFDEKWRKDNETILKSGNETAIRHYNQVYGAEQVTKAAEEEKRKLSERIDARLNRAVSAGVALDENGLLKDVLLGFGTLQRMDEGLANGDLAPLTRPVNYRWQDVAVKVSGQVRNINARQNAPHNTADLELAARNEEEKVIKGQGTLIQKDAAPRSYTSIHESMPGLWAAGMTKDPLSAGWYAPAEEAQSGFAPGYEKAREIAGLRRTGDLPGAAEQEYDALTEYSGGDAAKLSTNEGAVRMAADLALDTAKAFSLGQAANPAVQSSVSKYNDVVNSILGIDPDAVALMLPQILYATTVRGGITNQAAGTIGMLSSILRLNEGALKTVTDHVLGETPSLQTAQTMFRVLKLRDMETGTKSEAYKVAEAALIQTTDAVLQTAAAQTGESELDGLTGITGRSSHNLDAVMKRWGMRGVNYISNLLKAGRGDLAAAIPAMPTYAKSAIIAETNMRTFGLNDDAIAAQENALKADMLSPIVSFCARQIAKRQAVDARKAELTAGAAPGASSALIQMVNAAGKTAQQLKAALDQAVRNEQACRNALYKAQDAFRKNMADSEAADVLAAAIEQLQKAAAVREKAQRAFTLNQQTLSGAQRKLTDAQKQAEARLEEQAKLDVDAMVKNLAATKTELLGMAGGEAGEQGNVLLGLTQPENVSKEGGPLAQMDGSSIIKENMLDFGLDTADIHKTAETNQFMPPLDKETMPGLNAGGKNGTLNPDLLKAFVSGDTVPFGSQKKRAEALLSKGTTPIRELASAGAATDIGYSNGYRSSKIPDESSTSGKEDSNPKHGKDGDVKVYWKDVQSVQVPTTSPKQTPSPIQSPTPTTSGAGDTVEVIPTPTSGVGTIPIITPDPSDYQTPYLYTQATPKPRKDTIKGVDYKDEKYAVYQQWAEQYFQMNGSMPNIVLPAAADEGWVPSIEKIRYETKTVKTNSPADVVKEAWGMIGEGTKLVADALGIAAQYYTNAPADKVSEVVDGVLSVLTEPQSFESSAQFLDKVYSTGGTFENMVKGIDQFFVDHTGGSYVQHILTIKWGGIPNSQNATYTYNVYEGQKVDKDVVAGFTNALFFGKELGWE